VPWHECEAAHRLTSEGSVRGTDINKPTAGGTGGDRVIASECEHRPLKEHGLGPGSSASPSKTSYSQRPLVIPAAGPSEGRQDTRTVRVDIGARMRDMWR
jgi:hypothetical protein